MAKEPYGDLLEIAHRLADAAATVQRRYFRTPVAVDTKADASPVTIADREAEAAMRDLLDRTCPGHGVYGEEYGAASADAEFVWVLDPIDGTKSFITGRPLFGTLVGLVHAGRPVLGIADHAVLGERWSGVIGQPTLHNGRPVTVRACPSLGDAVLFATTAMFEGADRPAFERVDAAARLTMYGSDCYAYGLLAAGFADLVVEAGLGVYDFVALVPIVTGAGGTMTDWSGAQLTLRSDGRVVAAGDARVADAARRLLSG
jgi:inositol-phosphate phosphatase / L-galactose 1-phosphate phosphatase / histidinol-phosphatase